MILLCHVQTHDLTVYSSFPDKQIDLSNVNLKKLKVKELKKILSDWEESCRGCTEKSDYVDLVNELMPKHAPESAAKRAAKTEL